MQDKETGDEHISFKPESNVTSTRRTISDSVSLPQGWANEQTDFHFSVDFSYELLRETKFAPKACVLKLIKYKY
jgi:hypothetical protein